MMPGPDEHRRKIAAITNPYEPHVNHVAEYTAQEIATLQSRLDKQLGPEYISSRPGSGGGKVHYLAADKVINLANEVFGFNGWSSQIQNVQIDFCDEAPTTGKISLGLSIITRITLRDGTFHEDIGYGHIENCKGKAAAFEKAKKEAATDALKRSLRNFGNLLGNCLYDKEYLARVTKLKPAPTKWEPDNLHRHSDFVPVKKELTGETDYDVKPAMLVRERAPSTGGIELEDEFGGNLFDESELPDGGSDEVALPPHQHDRPPQRSIPPPNPRTTPIRRSVSHPPQPHPSHGASSRPPSRGDAPPPPPPAPQPQHPLPLDQPNRPAANANAPIGFITSRHADLLLSTNDAPIALPPTIRFNPTAESPSIRKTIGFNHATSAPVSRTAIIATPADTNTNPHSTPNLPPNSTTANPVHTSLPHQGPPPANFINPADNATRRIGMPTSGLGSGSPGPLTRTSAYKPPAVVGVKRPPLADLSNTHDVLVQPLGSAEMGKKARLADA